MDSRREEAQKKVEKSIQMKIIKNIFAPSSLCLAFFSVFFEIEENVSECFSFCRWQNSAEAEREREKIDNEQASTLNRFACLRCYFYGRI
jgi:hypothetical protein